MHILKWDTWQIVFVRDHILPVLSIKIKSIKVYSCHIKCKYVYHTHYCQYESSGYRPLYPYILILRTSLIHCSMENITNYDSTFWSAVSNMMTGCIIGKHYVFFDDLGFLIQIGQLWVCSDGILYETIIYNTRLTVFSRFYTLYSFTAIVCGSLTECWRNLFY